MEHFISLDQAIQMTTRYRENKDNILADQYQGSDILAIAETFDRAAFDKLLAEPGCERLRIYLGMDDTLRIHAIIVGVNAEGQDILPAQTTLATSTTEASVTDEDDIVIVEAGQRCPPECTTSSLNG